ncbi:MAG: hydroxyphenylacetyl-CoA thioesterase PaaI [Candidatus Dormibacteria bacterium]
MAEVRGGGAAANVAGMLAADAASRGLGISIEAVEPGRATARMRIRPSMVNGHGIAHGGYLFLLADSAFAFACNSHGPVTVASAAEITFLAPGREGDDLVATAEERFRGGRRGVYDVTVRTGAGAVLAEFRGHSHTRDERVSAAGAAGAPAG